MLPCVIIDYQLPPKYQHNPVLIRGCFVLKVPDRCYTATNGLSYCWCSTKDLCNSAPNPIHRSPIGVGIILQYVLTSINHSNTLPAILQNGVSVGTNVFFCFQLLLSAFFWYTYNNTVHRAFFQHHENILWWEMCEGKKLHMFLLLCDYCIKAWCHQLTHQISENRKHLGAMQFSVWRFLNSFSKTYTIV